MICCFTGHRPHLFPWGNDLKDARAIALLDRMESAVIDAINSGTTEFICGGALGVDTWAAKIILQKKKQYPQVTLTLAVPYQEHNSDVQDIDYLETKEKADKIIVISQKKGKKAFLERDRWMVDHSDRVIAVYEERSGIKGGTFFTYQYAKETDKQVVQIKWMDLNEIETNVNQKIVF
ncbi:MAG: DUF1273 family protein [Oscillospiraceae bacterium]|nr:DUF1273 family protein [Oscillospiraceae bacterium]